MCYSQLFEASLKERKFALFALVERFNEFQAVVRLNALYFERKSFNQGVKKLNGRISTKSQRKSMKSLYKKKGAVALSGSLLHKKKHSTKKKVECFPLLWYNFFAQNKLPKASILYHVLRF